MKVSKQILPLILISVLVISTGCAKIPNTNTSSNTNATTINNTNIEKTISNKNSYETVEFDAESELYVSPSKQEMPYKISGTMSIPKGEGKSPLVLITHGSHENIEDNIRFDKGFKYLTEKLAENGYIAVAMEINNAYLWKYGDNDDNIKVPIMVDKYIESLKLANEGKNNKYKVDLKDKIDFDKVALVGHSRGGEAIFKIAQVEEKKGQKICAILSIAPTSSSPDTPFIETDIDTSILVPEYDGDVTTLDGFGIYDILTSKKRESFVGLTYLEKANHNYFNADIKPNDAELLAIDVSDQLTREKQQDFLANYAVDFFNASMKDKVDNTAYDSKLSSIDKMYGYDVKTLFSDKNKTEIISIKDKNNFKSDGIEISITKDGLTVNNDEAQGVDTVPASLEGFNIRDLLNIKWKKADGKISFNPNTNDFSQFNSLSINIVQDPSDELNTKGENQAFTVQIKDKKGNISKVTLDKNIPALDYINGKAEFLELEDSTYKMWSSKTPLTSIKIPLTLFKDLDLSNIDEVSLIFDKTDSGSVMIGAFELN
ncbi:MAG: alpha/beta hydrolase [Romboutsia sp.]